MRKNSLAHTPYTRTHCHTTPNNRFRLLGVMAIGFFSGVFSAGVLTPRPRQRDRVMSRLVLGTLCLAQLVQRETDCQKLCLFHQRSTCVAEQKLQRSRLAARANVETRLAVTTSSLVATLAQEFPEHFPSCARRKYVSNYIQCWLISNKG